VQVERACIRAWAASWDCARRNCQGTRCRSGAAAAIAAAFNTPLPRFLVCLLEEVVGDMHAPVAGSRVVSLGNIMGDTAACLLEMEIFFPPGCFRLTAVSAVHSRELGIYAILGGRVASCSVALQSCPLDAGALCCGSEKNSTIGSNQWRAGLMVGVMGLVRAQLLGVGFTSMLAKS